ncbi:MAG: hypothetical protein EP329_20090 [Deltaproteobacteria bacterium]|nr:MAG: hypothetical protein EP329_20090 [Deltaproteobacteria bacterium]
MSAAIWSLLILGLIVALLGGAALVGALRWRAATRALVARLEEARPEPAARVVDLGALDGLPAPVQRFFRASLREGQAVAVGAHIRHRGRFDLGDAVPRWRPFTSTQRVVTRRPGFVWTARVRLSPWLGVRVHDAYVGGEGRLHAALLGLVTVAAVADRREMAAGELVRFLAEAAWYPSALLPTEGVRWEPVDDRSARATLVDDGVAASLVFTFDGEDRLVGVATDARPRLVDGVFVPTPWRGRFWGHAERDGVVVPLDGEIAWVIDGRERPYWRAHIDEIAHLSA